MHNKSNSCQTAPLINIFKCSLMIGFILLCNGCMPNSYNAPPKKELQLDFLTAVSVEERSALNFLLYKQSSSDYAVYTNYKETEGDKALSTGHENLSESIGLMMAYALNRHSEPLFDTQFQALKKDFLTDQNLTKWRIHKNEQRSSNSSALVDDLRIMKALYQAGDLWNNPSYTQLATAMSDSILLHETRENTFIELYDGFEKGTSTKIPLFYLDLPAMKIAALHDPRWQPFVTSSTSILTQGQISKAFPLYHHTFDYSNGSYYSNDNVNMIEALLPLLSLYESGQTNDAALLWLAQELDQHKAIYSSYRPQNGTPATTVESTAVYALAARVAHLAGRDALSTNCLAHLTKLQVKQAQSPLFGAFGDSHTQTTYSFDNLQALLAYSQP